MFSNLGEKLEKALQILKGHGSITEINVAETLKEVRRALLDADVNFKTARDFTQRVKEKAIGQNVLTNLNPHDRHVVHLEFFLHQSPKPQQMTMPLLKLCNY